MSYLSRCPGCQTIHRVSLQQLSLTGGRVRCAHCQHKFNAYHCFITTLKSPASSDSKGDSSPQTNYRDQWFSDYDVPLRDEARLCLSATSNAQRYVLDSMAQKTSTSDLSLWQYLHYVESVTSYYHNQIII